MFPLDLGFGQEGGEVGRQGAHARVTVQGTVHFHLTRGKMFIEESIHYAGSYSDFMTRAVKTTIQVSYI